MSEQYIFTTSDNFDQEPATWTNQLHTPVLNRTSASLSDSMNDTFVTAIEDNDTQYLSVLETTNEVTLEDLHNLTLDESRNVSHQTLSHISGKELESSNVNVSDVSDQQVVVFTIDGSDDLYGIQFAEDEEGNVQRYQFQFRQTEQGTLEAIPETIQLLPNDDELQDQEQNYVEAGPLEVDKTCEVDLADRNLYQQLTQLQSEVEQEQTEIVESNIIIKREPEQRVPRGGVLEEHFDEQEQQENEFEKLEDGLEQDEALEDATIDIKPEILELATSNIKQEVFNQELHQHSDQVYHHQEESAEEEVPHIANEETLVFDDGNYSKEIIEDDSSYTEVVTVNKKMTKEMILESQHYDPAEHVMENGIEEDVSETDEVPQYNRLFIEEELQQDAVLYNSQEADKCGEEESNDEESDAEDYQIATRIHVTADGELSENSQFTAFSNPQHVTATTVEKVPVQIENSNVLKQPTLINVAKDPKKTKKLICYFVPHPEKENLNELAVNTINNCVRSNPRSVLKPQALELKLVARKDTTTFQEREALKRLEKMEKRFSKSKEAVQQRLFNNFINKTTIPHAPVRQKRLPRKQEIKPVATRREEEIIVQEVMVSSKGFVESLEDRLHGKDKLEVLSYIELVDSDDENLKTKKKKKKQRADSKDGVIEILSSDEEESGGQARTDIPKRGRGRPKKSSEAADAQKRDRENSTTLASDNQENSPSKRSRTESSEAESDNGKTEIICPHCPKTFPSPNSLSTHIQHHNLENRLRKTRSTMFEFKHKCNDCEKVFKNGLLLNRHDCQKKKNQHRCEACKKDFHDLTSLNVHNKSHNIAKPAKTILESTLLDKSEIAAAKYVCQKCQLSFKNAILQKRHVCQSKSNKFSCGLCSKTFEDVTMLNIHKRKHAKDNMVKTTIEPQLTPKKMAGPSRMSSLAPNRGSPSYKVLKKFSCNNCSMKFTSRILLDMHTRRNCVKTPTKKTIAPGLSITMTTPLDMNAQCDECSMKFKLYTTLLKHQIQAHGHSPPAKEAIVKPKKKLAPRLKEHGGILANPRLAKAFSDLMAKVQSATPRKNDVDEISTKEVE